MRRGDDFHRRSASAGFTYVALLAVVASLGVSLAMISTRWADQLQRERETQLLRVGQLYATAIASYYRGSPGSSKTYPMQVSDLLQDPRTASTVRHLRTAYADPLQPSVPLGLIRSADGTIRGVFSTSTATPFLAQGADLGITQLLPAQHYADWHFIPKVDP